MPSQSNSPTCARPGARSPFASLFLDPLMERSDDSRVERGLWYWVVSGIAFAVLLTGLMGFLSWRSAEKAAEDADWVAHTHAVQTALAVTARHAVDVETGARGFAATGDEIFLEPYQRGQAAVALDLDRLRQLTSDNPAQRQPLDQLQLQIDARIETAKAMVIDRRVSGTVPDKAVFLEGKRRMDEVRTTVAEMQSEENRLLEQRASKVQEARHSMAVVNAVSTLTGMILLLLAGSGIGREIMSNTRLHGRLQALNADLENRVQQRTAALQAEVTGRRRVEEVLREQAALLNLAHDAIFVRDLESRILFWNPGAQDAYGWSAKEAKGHVTHDLLQTKFPIPLEAIDAVLREKGEWNGELRHTTRGGKEIVVASRWSLRRDEGGKPTAILEINRDITERKRAAEALAAQAEELFRKAEELVRSEREIRSLNEGLEQRVHERTAELEAANKELEAFTYSVSHDLRAPLRHISGFTKMLTEEYGAGVPPEVQHYLQRIQEATRRMGLLVDDLLNLARIGRQELRLQVTGLESITKDVIADLGPDTLGRTVEWKIGSLPFVECDPALTKQVFQNLLSNAVKFTRPRPQAVIEIGQKNHEGAPLVFVRDNGVGFSMKYADKLFGVFQRLHRPEDFEGTGVGLATVQRIIQKHGGRIWAEAELDKGATFYFTLGASEKNELKTKAAAAGEKA